MSVRIPLIAGNWKMHGTLSEAINLVDSLRDRVVRASDREVLVAPAFPVLHAVSQRLAGSPLLLGAQNMHWEDKGALTGEVSGPMLRSIGCTHVIVGHSERRQFFGETNATVARRTRAALRNGLVAIVCVGETLEERESNKTLAVITEQIQQGLKELSSKDFESLVIAYEPVWAIGTGKVATPEQAQEVHQSIRRLVGDLTDPTVAARLRILYGGSVKPDNIQVLMQQPDVDGALVGGASLDADAFCRIIQYDQ